MGFARRLIHTCTIKRYTRGQGSTGATTRTLSATQTEVACRLHYPSNAQRVAYPVEGQMVLTDAVLLLASDADIETDDTVESVVLASDGTTFDAGTYEVMSIVTRQNRRSRLKSVNLRRIA